MLHSVNKKQQKTYVLELNKFFLTAQNLKLFG